MAKTNSRLKSIYTALKDAGADVGTEQEFNDYFLAPGDKGYKNRMRVWQTFNDAGADVGKNYEEFRDWLHLGSTQFPPSVKPVLPAAAEDAPDKGGGTGAKTPVTRPIIGGIPAAKMPEGAMRFNSADLNNWKQRSLSPAKTVNRERLTPLSEIPNPEVQRVNDVVGALRGDEEAAKRAGLDKAMPQARDRIDYWLATGGKELTGPIEDSEILAPTVGRDAEGRVITDAEGNPMTGVTNDPARVGLQKYGHEAYKQAKYNSLSAQMERAQQELEDLDKQLETPQTELGSMFSAPLLRDEKRVTIERARKQVEERIKGLQVEMAGGEQGFWKGLTDAALDKSTWMFGLDKLADSARALRIANKMRNGEQITDEERALLEATMANQEVQQRLDDNSNFMYRAGRMTTEMVPFMIGIGATGGMSGVSGIGVNAGRRAMAAYARKYGTDALRHRVAEGMLQGTGALVGDLMAGVAMANTVGAANTLSDILDRRIGRLEYDPEGNPVFVGGKSWGESIYQGEVGQSLEYATEMMGAHILEPRLSRLVKFAGETGGLRGAARVVKGIAGNDTYKATANWLKRMGIQDIPSEGLEEEVNMLLGIGLHADDTDEQVRQFLDSDTHKEIWGGMGLSIAFMHGFGAGAQSIGRAYNEVQYARYKTKVDDASKVAGFRLGEDRWDAWKKKIDNTQNEDMGNIYTQVLDETSMAPEEKQAVVDYMQKLTSMRGYNLGRFRATQENASAVMPDEMAAHDTYNEGVLARGGERNAVGRQAREAASALNALPDGEGIGQEIDRLVNEDESYMVVEGYLNNLSEESREAARAYYLSAIRSKGVWDNAQEEVDNRVKDFEQSLAPGVVENEDGRSVMLANVQGAPALVVSDNGDTAVIYQNGRKRQVKSSEVRDVEIYDYDRYVNSYRQQEEQKATAEVEFALNNHANTQMPSVGLTLHEGEDTYQVTGINPSTGEVTATKVKLDKDGQLVPDGGAMVTLTEQEVLDLQNPYYEDLDARKAGLAAQPQLTEQPEAEQGTEEEPTIEEVPAADEPGTVTLEEQRNAVLAIDPEAQDLLDTIEWQINDYGVVAEGFWDSVPRELEEPLREYARIYAEAPVVEEAPEGEVTVPAVEVPSSGNTSDAQPTETELPRDEDGDLDIDAIRQTGDSQVMADALKAEFGDETANAVAQEYLTEAVKAQEKEKNPAKKMGSKKKAVDFWREVAGKLNVSAEGGSTAKATDTERADTNGMLQAGAAATEKWAQAEKIVGAEGIYTMDDGSDISGRYVLVEEGSTTPSHDPHTFNSSEGYPVNEQGQNANSRDYQNSPNAQASVVQMGNDYDGRALKDVPVVSADGIVWSGNNRTMSGMLAAENGRDGKYIESLKRQAARFGFTPEQIEGVQHPRVVFVPDEGQGLDYTPQTFNRFNAPSQKEEGSVEKGVKMGKVLSDHTFNLLQQEVARFGGLSGVFKSPNACREILRIMQEAAEIVEVNQQTLPRYITPDGLLTEEGQNLLESALVGYVFKNNPEVVSQIDKLPKRALNQLAEAMPEITANASAGEYALMGELAEAVRTLVEQQASGQSLDEYMKQMDLFRENTLVAKTTEALVRALDARTGTPLKDILSQYNDRAVEAASGQEDMFSDNSREGILRDVLGAGENVATQSQQTEPSQPQQMTQTEEGYGKGNKLVSRDRYEELKKRMQAKLRGQANAGFDPEILAIGTEMAMFHVEAGARTFIDFAKRMINDLGDAIRPYLKAIYNGAKDMPGMEELRKTMTSYEGVMNTDVNGIGETAVETAGTTEETAGTMAEETGTITDEEFRARALAIPGITVFEVHDDHLLIGDNRSATIYRFDDYDRNDEQLESDKEINERRHKEHESNVLLSQVKAFGDKYATEWMRRFNDGKLALGMDWVAARQIAKESLRAERLYDEVIIPYFEQRARLRNTAAEGETAVETAGTTAETAAVRKDEDAEKYRAFSQSVADDMLKAVKTGEKPYKSIVDIRAKAKALGLDIDEGGRDDILLQELVEDGLVSAARQYVNRYIISAMLRGEKADDVRKSRELFNEVVRLYSLQPTISQRSTNRIRMQQYSTPLPMSFAADMFAFRERMRDVLEPTAGNGMLVFAIPEGTVHANELDKTRLDNLRAQKFKRVTDQDAMQPFEGDQLYDAVITNPPFGNAEAKEYDGKMIPGLAPQIALNALSKMKDNGKAVIIIGGNMTYGKNGGLVGDKQFFTYLYDHYNVKGVIDMDGKLYQKQGTTYPTRMILIDGRRSEADRELSKVYPPRESEALPKAETFDDLYRIVTEVINSNKKTNGNEVLRAAGGPERIDGKPKSRQTDLFDNPGQSDANDTNGRDRGTRTPVRGRSNSGNRGNGQGAVSSTSEQGGASLPGLGVPEVPGGTGNQGRGGTSSDNGIVPAGRQSESNGETGRGVANGGTGRVQLDRAGGTVAVGQSAPRVEQKPKEQRKLNQEKLSYRTHNTAFSLESVAPAAMVESMDASLSEIEKEVGSIDEFVRSELGYDTIEEAHNALAAEQMDSVAMAIYQMKKGNAMIIGDQTGVGKGRQMAALIRWAVKHGKKPVFITKDANLFSDIYRDLVDICSGDLRPFIFNSATGDNPGVMTDKDGNVVYRALDKAAQNKVLAGDKLPDDYDYAVLSYSQVNTGDAKSREEARQIAKKNGGRAKKKDTGKERPTPKADFLRKIAKDNIMLLDESHSAAGESNTGAYLQSLVKDAKGVTFASATFAKRPDTMPLYAIRTAMSKANVKPDELIAIIEKGGVTLQEIMSRALSESGQMVRRERDMSDVKTDWTTVDDEATVKRARENYDRTIEAFNAIIQFQKQFVEPKIAELDAELGWMASSADVKKGTKNAGVDNPPFVNKTFNYTKQLLLALKVDAIVDQVEAEIKTGRHPVIALESTMESSLSDFAVGEAIEEPTFALSLLRGLDTVMQYTVKDEDGKETHATYSPAELGPVGEKAYYTLQDFIRKATQDVFISPLDAIIEKLNERGYKVGELTGRETYLGKDGEGNTVVKSRGKVDKKKLARDFNSGKLDVLILNKSASTGISLHASKKFADQRQRTMVIAQPLSDINDYMQMIGRIDRTGQVHRGYYINLGLPVPAESRFLMMLATKLKSLNANTTTSQESKSSDVEAPDLLNKYGSQVIIEYLRDNPEVYEKMGQPLGKQSEPVKASELEEYRAKEDDASRITGRVALLSTAEQDAFYDDVVKRYNDLIKYLDETGTNDLKITVLPLRAKTTRKKVSSEGADPKGRNPFAQNAYVEEVEMDVLRKPMKADEVRKAMAQLNKPLGVEKGHMRNAYQDELAGERVLEIVGTVEREREAKLQAEDERYDREKSKAEDGIRKRTEKINASTKASEAEKREAIETYAEEQRAKVDEAHEGRVNAINNQAQNLTNRLGWFAPGQTYLVPDNLDTDVYMFTSPAIFCGYKAKESKVTPSTTFAVFATLDGRRRIEVKMSQIGPLTHIKGATDNNLDTARRTNLDNWDSQLPTNTRKKGYIMTGNILQAVADTQDQNGNYPGQLISFTDENGEIRDGILMPDKWEPGQLKTAGAPILSRIEQIKKLRVYDGPIVSTDGKVQIKADYGGSYHLRVPKSKKEGGQYFLNDDLLALVELGEFYQRAGMMQADVEGDRIEDVVKLLSQMGVRVSSEDEMEGTTADATGAGARFSVQRQTRSVDILEEARSMAAEDERRKPLREHAKIWEETVGVKINLVEREGEIRDAYVLEALRDGEIVKGWFNPRTGEVYLYLPNIKSNGEIDQTILHEVIAHKGLRELLGEREFNRLCDLVFDAMPEKDKKAFLTYPGVDKLSGLEAQRAAADEYMAHVSETLDIYPSVWKRIVEAVRRWLRNRGLNLSISDGDIETVLRASLNNLMRNAPTITTEEGTRMMVQEQSVESGEAGARFRVVTDPYEIARLNSEPTARRYRAMAQIDGKLYPPMSVKFGGEMRPETPEGVWEVSEETPFNITQEQQAAMDALDKKAGSGDVVIIPDKVRYHKDGKTPYDPETGKGSKGILQFKLVKDEGTPIWAVYNPYFHTSTSGLNDQFTSAYKRPNLVVVEVEIPESELTAGHRSAYAKDAVGDVDWKSGVVNNALPEGRQRTVILSRWARVSRVVPDAEVADMVASQLEGSNVEIPFNVVTPSLRDELAKRGIKIGEPTKGNAGKAARTEYEAWKKGAERRSVGRSLWNDSPEVLNYGRPGIGVKYGLRGVSNHQYIRSAEDVRLLAEMLPKKYAEQLRKYYLDGTTKGYYSPALDMVIVFAEKSPNIIEAELTEWHEQTHAVYEHLDMPDKEECANELLEYMKTEYPDTYEHITGGGRYIPKYWGNEALAYFVEDYIRLYGVENFLRLQFGGNEKISKLVAEIQKAFINGNEQKGPEAGHKEPSKRDGGGRNEAENNNSDRPYQGRTGLDGRGSRTETGRVAGESAETSGRAGEVESGGVGRIQASSSATPSSGIEEEHRSIARNAGLAQAEYDATVSGFAHRMRETWQDSMLSLKRLQDAVLKETGGRLLDSQNAWMAENRLSSSNAAQQEEFRNTLMAALVDAVAALGGADERQYERIKKYMIAKHGLERNIVFAERDAREAAGADSGPEYDSFLEKFRKRDYSGLTGLFGVDDVEDAEDMARDYVDRFEDGQDEEIADLWDAVRGVSGFALQKSLDSGMISQETFDTLRAQFENYIPLRGWDETTSDEVYDYIGRQVAGVQDIMKHAKGRKSVADDPLATLQNLAESAIIIGNRNMVKQHFLNLATMHKTSLVSVSSIWLRYNDVTDEWEAAFPAIDDNDSAEEVARKTEAFNQQMESLAQFDPDHYKRSREKAEIPFIVRPGSLSSHQVLVKQGGRTYVLTVNGNPRAAEAVNGLTNPDAEGNAVMKAVSAGSRWIASWSTAKNVGFIASNLVRDGLYTGPMAFIKEGGAYGARYTANWWACARQLPKLLRMLSKDPNALKHAAQNNPNSLEGMFYDFVHNGGETGYTIVSDVEDCKKYIEKELRGGTIRKPWDFLNEILQFLGRWSEGVGRFAAYRTSREMGRSKARAIYDAKDISVNFSKKGAGKSTSGTWEGASARDKFLYTMGSMSQMSRAFYSFFNASVQGLENIARASWHNKEKAMGLFGGLMAMGAGQAYINELLKAIIGGDDDDDYYNLPEWQRSSNIILYLGKYWPGGWLKLPLPIEFGVPFGLGGLFAEYANDSELMSGRRFGLRFAQQLGKAMPLDPTSEDTYFNTTILWPTALKPIAEVGENRSWTGLPIANQTEWNKRKPEYQRVYSNAGKGYVGVSRALSELTGGTPGRRGGVEINPQKMQYLIKQYLSGGYNWFERPVKIGQDLTGEKDFEWQDVPVLYRFTTKTDQKAVEKRINSQFFDLKDEMDGNKYERDTYARAAKASQNDTLEYAKAKETLEKYENSPAYTEYMIWHMGDKQLQKIREQGKEGEDVEENEYMLKQQMIDAIRTYRKTRDENKAIDVYPQKTTDKADRKEDEETEEKATT